MNSNRRTQARVRPVWWDDDNDRAMLICRISDKKQKDGVSLEAQEHHCKEYAKHVELQVAATRSFQESAKKSTLRAEFHAAVAEARRSKIRHLVFYVYDRIARNFTDIEMLEELIRDGEITVHIASGGTVIYAGSDDSAFFGLDINMAQAKQDNRARRRKTIDGMEQRCRNGWYPSRPPSFYRQAPVLDEEGRPRRRGSTVVGPSPEGRALVRREAALHLQGVSLELVRKRCIAEGLVPAGQLARYTASMIDRHLKNCFYAALANPRPDPERPGERFVSQFVWRKIRYEGKHEPIFTADEWKQLQASFGLDPAYRKRKHEGLFAQGPLGLKCAHAECGCKITYAPITKKAVTYRYYRCADGRRVHRESGARQINVRETDILDQFQGAVDAIQIGAAFAEAVANALNETHREAMAKRAKAGEIFRAEIHELERREDRLFDRFDTAEIDRETYDRQLARLRADKADRFERLRAADTDTDSQYLVTAKTVLELARDARSLMETRSDADKVQLLSRLLCNPRLDGRTVRFDLRKPFAVLAQMRTSDGWRPQRVSTQSAGPWLVQTL